jgi:dTDP-4-amino-4,6-dideoxygalactose transaminase
MQSEPATTRAAVPFFDLGPSTKDLKHEILEDVATLIDEGSFTNGRQVQLFEEAFASYCDAPYCIGVASGLDALRLALLAADIEPGDEVIVPAMTFVATLEAVSQAGGRPVLADIGDSDYCLDVERAAMTAGGRTRFVMPVHLYGQMADMGAVARLADERGMVVVEDACQAHGAVRDGIAAGTAGLSGAFSFYPAKNLGGFGDAGALVTNDATIAARVRALREHGQSRKYRHDVEGYTARLDTIQALVLLHKLPFLDEWNEERRAAARLYGEALDGVGDLRLPPTPPGSEHVWHLYVVRTDAPESLADHLQREGIRTGRHYPEPPHLSNAYAHLGYGIGDFPVAEALAREAISLPLFPGITERQIDDVVRATKGHFAGA